MFVPQIVVVVTPDGVVAMKESAHTPVTEVTEVTKFVKSNLEKKFSKFSR